MDYDNCYKEDVIASDGRTLQIHRFEPADDPSGVALIVPAMATPSPFYACFAQWLTKRGLRVFTFDYRGTTSRAAVKAETANLDGWMADVGDILATVSDQSGDLPLTWIGHSLGGQIVPFADHERLASVLLVSAGEGYWQVAPPKTRRYLPLLWWVLVPLVTRLMGYFPGARLRIVGDIPADVMRQWGRWCRHSDYLAVDHPDAPAKYARVKSPITSVSFADDEIISSEQVGRLLDRYTDAPQVRLYVDPAALDGRQLGHHGIFRASNADLWQDVVIARVPGARMPEDLDHQSDASS